jgi:hypothetical protein
MTDTQHSRLQRDLSGAERFLIKSVMAQGSHRRSAAARGDAPLYGSGGDPHREPLVYDAAVQEHYDLKTIEDIVDRDFSRQREHGRREGR